MRGDYAVIWQRCEYKEDTTEDINAISQQMTKNKDDNSREWSSESGLQVAQWQRGSVSFFIPRIYMLCLGKKI